MSIQSKCQSIYNDVIFTYLVRIDYILQSLYNLIDSQRVVPSGSSQNIIKHVKMAFRVQLSVGNEGSLITTKGRLTTESPFIVLYQIN